MILTKQANNLCEPEPYLVKIKKKDKNKLVKYISGLQELRYVEWIEEKSKFTYIMAFKGQTPMF